MARKQVVVGKTVTKEVVQPDEILRKEAPGTVGMKGLTGMQRAGFWLTVGVGAVTTLVICGLGLDWMVRSPLLPAFSLSLSGTLSGTEKEMIGHYSELSDIATGRTLQLFNQFVVSALLPIFTLLLGYTFGSREAQTTTEQP